LLRMLPANGAHTNTSDRRVSDPENQVPAWGSKDRCRAILKNRERRLSSRRRPCDCQHLLAQYCSSRPDESRSWAASSRFRAARRARYVRSTGDQLHCPCCLAALSSPAPQAPQGATKSWHPAPERARAESSVSAYLRVGIGTPNIRVDRFLRLAVRFRLVLFAFRFLAM
jgi:hypothetical protein